MDINFEKITIYSANLVAQKIFYTETLGFELLKEEQHCFTLKAGKTALQFVEKQDATTYHYAFNIPSNQGAEALAWLRQRVTILDCKGATWLILRNGMPRQCIFMMKMIIL